MPITVCPNCGTCYEAASEEAANAPLWQNAWGAQNQLRPLHPRRAPTAAPGPRHAAGSNRARRLIAAPT
jgi:hypothetical protein